VKEGAPESIHLCDYPRSDPALIDSDLEASMDAVMCCVSLVRAARNRAKIKVKQPLPRARIKLGALVDGDILASLLHHLKEEVNVKEVLVEKDLSAYVTYEVLPRFDLLGPRLGDKVKAVKQALSALDAAAIARLEAGLEIKVQAAGEEIELGPSEVVVRRSERAGHLFESDGATAIVLDVALTPELLAEGHARELVSRIQNLRKQSGFDVTDKIAIHIAGGDQTAGAFALYGEHIKSETLAVSVAFSLPAGAVPFEFTLGGEKVAMVLERK
jgi:isoleucyl-tRNA synthetase